MYDIIVVGGGPVGSYVAGELSGMGHKVALLERHKHRVKKLCTGIISGECVHSFAIEDSIILRPINLARLFSPSGKIINVRRNTTLACIVDRAALNQSLLRQAQEKGVDYFPGHLAQSSNTGYDCITIEATCQTEMVSLKAKAAVIATGFGSTLGERLGLPKISDYVLGAQVEVETTSDEIEVYFGQKIAPGFFAWLVPTSSNKALVGLLTRRSPQIYIENIIESLLAQKKIASIEGKPSYAGIPLEPLGRTYGDRLIAVGDAAGQVKPTTGGGIYYGLLCAAIAAKTLHEALEKDDLSANALAVYEKRWQERLGRELEVDRYARKFYERLSDRRVDKLFDIIETNGIDRMLLEADDVSFDWHSKAILRLVKHRLVSGALELMKMPFRLVS